MTTTQGTTLTKTMHRIEDLATIEDGWLDGAGSAMTPAALDTAKKLAEGLSEENLDRFAIFPRELGGLSFEYMRHDDPISIELDIEANGTLILFALNHNDKVDRYIEGVTLEDALRFAADPMSGDVIHEQLYRVDIEDNEMIIRTPSGQEQGRFVLDNTLHEWAREMRGSLFTQRILDPVLGDDRAS